MDLAELRRHLHVDHHVSHNILAAVEHRAVKQNRGIWTPDIVARAFRELDERKHRRAKG